MDVACANQCCSNAQDPTLCVFMVTLSSLEQKPCPSHLSKPAITPPQFHIILPRQVLKLQR